MQEIRNGCTFDFRGRLRNDRELGDEDADGEDEVVEEEPESPKGTKRKHDETVPTKDNDEKKPSDKEEKTDGQEDAQENGEEPTSKSRKVDDAEVNMTAGNESVMLVSGAGASGSSALGGSNSSKSMSSTSARSSSESSSNSGLR